MQRSSLPKYIKAFEYFENQGGTSNAGLIDLLKEVKNWNEFHDFCKFHGMHCWLYHFITCHDVNYVPKDFLKLAKDKLEQQKRLTLLFKQELFKLTSAFDNASIDYLTFKGPVLAEQAYSIAALRPYQDLDILIKKKDYYKVKDVFKGCGYYLHYPKMIESEEKKMLNIRIDNTFKHKDLDIAVELHWDLFDVIYPFPIPLNRFWDSKKVIKLDNHDINTFSNEYQLLYLCFHGNKHCWERWEWLQALNLFTERNEFDEREIIRICEKYNVSKMLSVPLTLCEGLWGTKKTRKLKLYYSENIKFLGDNVMGWMIQFPMQKYPPIHYFRYNQRIRVGWDKFKFIAAWSFLPTFRDTEVMPLPHQLYWLYYVLHPVRQLLNLTKYLIVRIFSDVVSNKA